MSNRPPDQREPGPILEEEETDFQRFRRNAVEFFDQYGTTILLVLLVVAGTVFVTRWYAGREERAREAAYTELAQTTSPLGMQQVAQEYEHVPRFAGKAYLQAADTLVNEAIGIPIEPGAEPRELTEQERQENLERAAALYERVIERRESSLQVLNARFGLASVYENLGDFEAAAEQYAQAAEEAAEQWPALASKAGDFRDELDRVAQPVHFPDRPARPEETDELLRFDPDAAPGDLPDLPLTLPEDPDAPAPPDAAPDAPTPDQPVIPEPEPDEEEAEPDFDFDLDLEEQ